MKTNANDIAVIGMSCIFPGAKDLASYWENIVTKKSGIRVAPESRVPHLFFDSAAQSIDRHSVNKGGFVDEFLEFDPIEFGMVPNAIQGTEAEHLVALKLAKTALEDAGIFQKKLSLENAGIIIGKGSFGGKESLKLSQIVEGAENISGLLRILCPQLSEDDISQVKQAYQARIGKFNSQNIMGVVPNLTASLVANRFNFGGPAYTLDAACASSLLGIESGMRELQSGRCDIVVVGAIHLLQCPAMFSFFQTLGALSKRQEVRPFDQQADGILTGEGCGFIVLKRLQDAVADGHRIYSVIKGIGISSDGSHASVMSPSSIGQVKAINRAWDMTGYSDRQVGYVEAHGTGTVLGDETELQTLITAFPHVEGTEKAGLGAVKALIGHAMAAAGMAGFIKTVMALHKGIIPPTINCSEPLTAMLGSHFQPVTEAMPWDKSGLPRRAGVNAFGFGGTNAHVVLEHYENSTREEENAVVLLARDSSEALIAAILNRETDIGQGQFRIALFNPTEKRRELALRIIQKGIEWKDRQDVWFSSNPLLSEAGSKLAFLFPGLDVPAINGLNDADVAQLAISMQISASANFLKSSKDDSARKLENFQLMIDAALKKLGVQPDTIAGHSLGEWTAGRSISLLSEDLIDKIDANLSSKEHPPMHASFLSISCSLETLQPYMKGESEVYISNDNCKQQVVVSAAPERAKIFQNKLLADGIVSHILPFETGYHTPFAEIYVKGARDALAGVTNIEPPKIPIWSCISSKKYEPSIATIQSAVVDFITHPVRFREMIENMYDDGVRVFIQIGEGALTGFVANILEKKRFSIIASSSSKRGTVAQLQRVVAALFVDGRTADLSILKIANANNQTASNSTELPLKKGLPFKIELDYSPINFSEIIDQAIIDKVAMPTISEVENRTDLKERILNIFEQNLAQVNQAQAAFLSILGSSSVALQKPSTARTNIKKHIDFSLESFPYLIDHCPFKKRSITQNFDHEQQAIVPFTLFIDLVTEFFLASFPALKVSRITSIKVHQFLWVEEKQYLELKGEWQSETAMRFSIENVFEAIVHTDNNSMPIFNTTGIQAKELQPPVLATEIYSQGYMFHGPLYQGIKEIIRFTENSLETAIKGNSVKGAMLDNMGQTVGLLNHFLGNSLRSFPVGVEQIEFYQNPTDQTGDFHCKAYTTAEDENFYYSTIELTRNQQPWCKFSGWKTKKSDLDDAGWRLLSRIEGQHLSQRLGGGLFVLENARYKQANTWLIMAEIYLNNAENITYKELPVAKQREFLCRRIATKDAIRDVILNAQGRVTHPASFVIDNNDSDILAVSYGDSTAINISIASTKNCTVVMAGNSQELLVDVQEIKKIESSSIAVSLNHEEINLMPNMCNAEEWVARIQTAKTVYKKYLHQKLVSTDGKNNVYAASGFDLYINEKIIRTVKYKQYIIGWII